jgi:hypothetical protein
MDVNKFVSLLMASSTQAHVYHLHTPSYAQHKALEDYYTGIVPLVDAYVESYQGTYGKLVRPVRSAPISNDPRKALLYFQMLKRKIQKMKLPKDHLRNIQDTVMELITSTIYKLKFLS